MNPIPVNAADLDFVFVELVPKADQNGVQRRNTANVLQWTVRVLTCSTESRPVVTDVTIPADNAPELAPMSPVQFERLVARPWSQGDRSGVAFSADMVRPSSKRPTTPAPTPNTAEKTAA